MKIGDLPSSEPVVAHRPPAMRSVAPEARSVPTAPPADSVQIGAAPSPDLPATSGATAAAVAFTALSGGDVSREKLQEVAEGLARNGVVFFSRRKVLAWHTSWRQADPKRVAKALDKGLEDRLLARPRGMADGQVRNVGDLRELDAFYGSSVPEALPKPELARAVLDMEKAGFRFRPPSEYYNQNHGAYMAYNVLGGDPHDWGDTVKARTPAGEEHALRNADEALALAFLHGLAPAKALARPQHAESLKLLQGAGIALGSKPFDLYRDLASRTAPLTAQYDKETLAGVEVAELADPVKVTARLQGLKLDLEETRKGFSDRRDSSLAWKTLSTDGSPRPFTERLALFEVIHEAKVRDVPALYAAVLEAAGGQDPTAAVREALDLARAFRKPDGKAVAEAWNALREMASRPGALSPADLKLRFMTLLAQTQDPQLALGTMRVLGREGSYGDREGVFLRLAQIPKVQPGLALDALQALDEKGGLPADAEAMASLLKRGAGQAPALYRHMKDGMSPEMAPAFLDMARACPDLEALKPAWAEVARLGPERAPERAQAWRELLPLRHHQAATMALALMRDESDLPALKRLLPAVEPRILPDAWKRYAEHPRREVYLPLLEALQRTDAADGAMAMLERPELAAGGRPAADRAEALGTLIRWRRGRLEEAADDFRFAASWTPDGLPVAERARALVEFEKNGSPPEEARKALAAGVAHERLDSLVEAMKVGRTLGEARGLWQWLQEPGGERVDLLRLAGSLARDPGEVRRLLPALEKGTPTAADRERVADLAGRLRQSASKDATPLMHRFLEEVVAGDGTPCGPRLQAWAKLLEQVKNPLSALDYWPAVRGRADAEERGAALALLQGGRNAPDAVALLERAAAAAGPDEVLTDVAALLQAVGPDHFEGARRRLGEGTVEGGGLAGNTRFFLKLEGRDRWSAWDAVARPVGRESTADRQAAFLELAGAAGSTDSALQAWRHLTSWLAEGESVREVASSHARVQKVSQFAGQALEGVRHLQRAGRLGRLTVAEALDRLAAHLAPTVTGRGPDIHQALESLAAEVAAEGKPEKGIEVGDGGVRIGGVTLPGR